MGKKGKRGRKKKILSLDEFLSKIEDGNKSPCSISVQSAEVTEPKVDVRKDDVSLDELRRFAKEDEGGEEQTPNRFPGFGERRFPQYPRNYDGRRRREEEDSIRYIPPPYAVFMGNLSYEAREEDVVGFFSGHSVNIESVNFPRFKKGFCFIKFAGEEEANKVILKNLGRGYICGRCYNLQPMDPEKAENMFGDRKQQEGNRFADDEKRTGPLFGQKKVQRSRPRIRRFDERRNFKYEPELDRKRYQEKEEEKFIGFGTRKVPKRNETTERKFDRRRRRYVDRPRRRNNFGYEKYRRPNDRRRNEEPKKSYTNVRSSSQPKKTEPIVSKKIEMNKKMVVTEESKEKTPKIESSLNTNKIKEEEERRRKIEERDRAMMTLGTDKSSRRRKRKKSNNSSYERRRRRRTSGHSTADKD